MAESMPEPVKTRPFHIMAKPAGARCNLRCTYCYYLEKAELYPAETRLPAMDASLLEGYIRSYLAAMHDDDEVAFTWQGGEPTLMGLDFFKHALQLQERYGKGRRITNSLQTNGLLLDDAWCEFFQVHNFLIGLSLDGPARVHDAFRKTASGAPSHAGVMRGLGLLQQHGVAYNVLACVNKESAQHPLLVYKFLRDAGVQFIQFIPIVERIEGVFATGAALVTAQPGCAPENFPAGQAVFATPAGWPMQEARTRVTPWTVLPEDYGRFLTDIFDVWVKRDVGTTFVMNFEWAFANYMGQPGTVCHHQPTCGRSLVLEHTGALYACDHYVYPQFHRGHVLQAPLADIVDAPAQEKFGRDKYATLSARCKQCTMLKGCWGGCPKHRFVKEAGEEGQTSYLCQGYFHFFGHLVPYLKVFSYLIKEGRPASDILDTTLVFVNKE